MSDTFVTEPLPLPDGRPLRRAPRTGLAGRFLAAIESLVDASARQFEDADQSFYRFPPI
jgi:hypothetical protein